MLETRRTRLLFRTGRLFDGVGSNRREVVLADLGCAQLAWPDARSLCKPRPSDHTGPICTVEYRVPDLLLGSQRCGADLDVWSAGCVAAEFLREPLIKVTVEEYPESRLIELQFEFLGTLPKWMKSLPISEQIFGREARRFPTKAAPE